MSKKIRDVLDVLGEIRARFRNNNGIAVREIRINAIKAVAEERGVAYQTIGDAYLRRLEPDVKGTAAFDNLVEKWLKNGSMDLRDILERHSLDVGDPPLIRQLFSG